MVLTANARAARTKGRVKSHRKEGSSHRRWQSCLFSFLRSWVTAVLMTYRDFTTDECIVISLMRNKT